jgi:hypothetical protein
MRVPRIDYRKCTLLGYEHFKHSGCVNTESGVEKED